MAQRKRMQFIDAIKQKIASTVPKEVATQKDIMDAISRWERGEEPKSMLEHGIASVCEQIQKDIENS